MSKYINSRTVNIDPNDFKRLHYVAGLTLCATHQFEYGLKYLLYLLASHKLITITEKEATDIIEGRKKKTIGQVFHNIKDRVLLPNNILDDVENAISVRNQFIHGFYIENSELIANPQTRDEVIRKIKEIRNIIINADNKIEELLEILFNMFGAISWEELMKNYIIEMEELNCVN